MCNSYPPPTHTHTHACTHACMHARTHAKKREKNCQIRLNNIQQHDNYPCLNSLYRTPRESIAQDASFLQPLNLHLASTKCSFCIHHTFNLHQASIKFAPQMRHAFQTLCLSSQNGNTWTTNAYQTWIMYIICPVKSIEDHWLKYWENEIVLITSFLLCTCVHICVCVCVCVCVGVCGGGGENV